jgi:hypothetical protein
MRLTGNVTLPGGNWTLSRASITSREKKNSENTLKRRKTEKHNKEIHVNEQLLGCRCRRVIVETNHQTEEGNTSTVVCSSPLEEMISHKKITPALATMDVDIICKLTMIEAFVLVMSVNETNGKDERNVEQ